ncbi:MAG TPA: SURF1 family protein [Burkholderiaceae bacterium]
MRIRFGFRWITLAAIVALMTAGIMLGNWQLRRADEKRAIAALLAERGAQAPLAVDARLQDGMAIEYRRVTVQGEFDQDWPLYLDNRPQNGNAGFYVLMPFKIAGSDVHVLVQRGWVAVDPHQRTRIAAPAAPQGLVAIEGIAIRNPGHVLQLGQAPAVQPGAILQNLTVEEFAAASKYTMQPFVIEQTGLSQDGLVRDWPAPSAGIERHLGYAFQWYALAAMAFIYFVVTGFRYGKRQAAKPTN